MFDTPHVTLAALEQVGYLTDLKTATTVYLAGRINKPILLEGPAGAGKTELANSVAKAGQMSFIRLQCYEGITDKNAIGEYNRALQELYVLLKSKSGTPDWLEIQKEIISRTFCVRPTAGRHRSRQALRPADRRNRQDRTRV